MWAGSSRASFQRPSRSRWPRRWRRSPDRPGPSPRSHQRRPPIRRPTPGPKSPAPVVLNGETVIWVPAGTGPYSAQFRAERISQRLEEAVHDRSVRDPTVSVTEAEGASELRIGSRLLMAITQRDAAAHRGLQNRACETGRKRGGAGRSRRTTALRAGHPPAVRLLRIPCDAGVRAVGVDHRPNHPVAGRDPGPYPRAAPASPASAGGRTGLGRRDPARHRRSGARHPCRVHPHGPGPVPDVRPGPVPLDARGVVQAARLRRGAAARRGQRVCGLPAESAVPARHRQPSSPEPSAW